MFCTAIRSFSHPNNFSRRYQIVKHRGAIVTYAARQDVRFPCLSGQKYTLKLSNNLSYPLSALEARLSEWEGFLRAGGRAQTQELEALSQEISELLRDTRAALMQEVPELLTRELTEKNSAWLREARAEDAELSRQVSRLQARVTWLGLSCAAAFIALAVALAFW